MKPVAKTLHEAYRPLTRGDLNGTKCDNPECHNEHRIHLTSACHTDANVIAAYNREDGTLELYCGECQKPVVSVRVAYQN